MKLKVISWDVRGLSNVDTRGELKTLLRIWKPGITCFQEDKIQEKFINWSSYMDQVGHVMRRGG